MGVQNRIALDLIKFSVAKTEVTWRDYKSLQKANQDCCAIKERLREKVCLEGENEQLRACTGQELMYCCKSIELLALLCIGNDRSGSASYVRAPRHTENPYCEMVTPLRPFVVLDPSLFSRLPGHKRVSISVSKEMEFLGMPGCPVKVVSLIKDAARKNREG